jgi:hypothetical protein
MRVRGERVACRVPRVWTLWRCAGAVRLAREDADDGGDHQFTV